MPNAAARRRKDPTTTAEYRQLEPEAAFQTWVIATARLHRWRVAHVSDSRLQPLAVDLPDLVLARGGVVIVVELKSASGKLTDGQQAWLDAAGANGYAWRPGDRSAAEAVLS